MKSARIQSDVENTPITHDAAFAQSVIDWQRQHGRHGLPWQQTRDPYRVWLSEIMLQQTQVSAVIPYYERFLHSFPDVQALAHAPAEAVMAHWSGLGYYTRARNLHACAKLIVADYAGVFPSDPAQLMQLPGIGRSTAAAVAAFSYGTIAAILDGNVKRVFARVFGIDGYPGTKAIEDAMWLRANALLPQTGIESYTQGLMDLGATVCTRSKPACARCPLRSTCVAHATQRTAELPVRKPKKILPEKRAIMPVILFDGQILLQQRANSGIWGGLLSLPELDGMTEVTSLVGTHAATVMASEQLQRVRWFAEQFGQVGEAQALPAVRHSFTHFHLSIEAYSVQLVKRVLRLEQVDHVWLPFNQIEQAALPKPIKSLLMATLMA